MPAKIKHFYKCKNSIEERFFEYKLGQKFGQSSVAYNPHIEIVFEREILYICPERRVRLRFEGGIDVHYTNIKDAIEKINSKR